MYAVLRTAKLKTMGEIGALGKHNERTRDTPNADADRLRENVRLVGSGDWMADAQRRLDDAPMIRSDAVLAIEHVMTASRDFYARSDAGERAARLDDWTERSMAWLRERYGEANIVAAVLHKDEQTPHIQALVVPISDAGRLSAYTYTGGREKLGAMQDSYARAMSRSGWNVASGAAWPTTRRLRSSTPRSRPRRRRGRRCCGTSRWSDQAAWWATRSDTRASSGSASWSA